MNYFSRRSFLKSGSAGLLFTIHPSFAGINQAVDIKARFEDLRANIFQLVNEEREVEKVPLLELDELATRVATAHAEELAAHDIISHWGRNGLKPYQRYSFAGGYHATQENVSSADSTWSTKFESLKLDTSYLHVRMYQEKPPNDGHRQSILAPQHTHLGIGFAVVELRLRLVELFVARYVELKPVARVAKPGATIAIEGQLINPKHSLGTIEVFYEPLPEMPTLEWLRQARSYGLPDESKVLRPILTPPYLYLDNRPGVISIGQSGDFHAPITLYKSSPGIYTIVCWVKKGPREKYFPATELCIKAEA